MSENSNSEWGLLIVTKMWNVDMFWIILDRSVKSDFFFILSKYLIYFEYIYILIESHEWSVRIS